MLTHHFSSLTKCDASFRLWLSGDLSEYKQFLPLLRMCTPVVVDTPKSVKNIYIYICQSFYLSKLPFEFTVELMQFFKGIFQEDSFRLVGVL